MLFFHMIYYGVLVKMKEPKGLKLSTRTVVDRMRQRRYRDRLDNCFYSSFFDVGKNFTQQFRRTFISILKRTTQHVISHHLCDNIKAPYGTNEQPALLSKAPFNIYYGLNKEKLPDGSIIRSAYGLGSGSMTTGLDMRSQPLLPFFPDLMELRDRAEDIALAYCNSEGLNYDCRFDACSMKLYSDIYDLGWHTDMEFDDQHISPKKNNSQCPHTIVVIITFGDTKMIQLANYEGSGRGTKRKGKGMHTFRQKSGSVFILDPRDEMFNEKRTYWKHRAFLEDRAEGVSLAIMFRVTQVRVRVDPQTSLPVAAVNRGVREGIPGDFEKALDRGWKKLQRNRDDYERNKSNKLRKITERLSHYWD